MSVLMTARPAFWLAELVGAALVWLFIYSAPNEFEIPNTLLSVKIRCVLWDTCQWNVRNRKNVGFTDIFIDCQGNTDAAIEFLQKAVLGL
jgi:hypothetical protein